MLMSRSRLKMMVAVGVGTVVYAGLYLLILTRFGKGRWAKRWQLIKS